MTCTVWGKKDVSILYSSNLKIIAVFSSEIGNKLRKQKQDLLGTLFKVTMAEPWERGHSWLEKHLKGSSGFGRKIV